MGFTLLSVSGSPTSEPVSVRAGLSHDYDSGTLTPPSRGNDVPQLSGTHAPHYYSML